MLTYHAIQENQCVVYDIFEVITNKSYAKVIIVRMNSVANLNEQSHDEQCFLDLLVTLIMSTTLFFF